jgi:hypothetical protein
MVVRINKEKLKYINTKDIRIIIDDLIWYDKCDAYNGKWF